MMLPCTGGDMRPEEAGCVVLPTSATGLAAAGSGFGAAGFSSTGGSGFAALGGVGVGDPVPGKLVVVGAVAVAAAGTAALRFGAACCATGISRNCPSRTEKSAPSPFHSANVSTGTA